jgi:hypothetical protein
MRGSNPAFLHAEKKKHETKTYGATYCVNVALAKGAFANITQRIFETKGDELVTKILGPEGEKVL